MRRVGKVIVKETNQSVMLNDQEEKGVSYDLPADEGKESIRLKK